MEATATVSATGTDLGEAPVTVDLSFILLRVGRGLAALDFVSKADVQITSEQIDTLASTIAMRMKAGLPASTG